jgi:hypothetical protein
LQFPAGIIIPAAAGRQGSVWNLLFYDSFDIAAVDPLLKPGTLAGAIETPVTVTQFGAQSPGYWVMVVCGVADPTSFSTHLALQYFPATLYLNFVNSTFIQDLKGLQVSGFFSSGLPKGSQSGESTFQLINSLSTSGAASGLSGSFTNTFHEVWYLLGYPDVSKQGADVGPVNLAVNNAGGASQVVTVRAAQQFTGLLPQPGVWVLAKLPTILETNGGLALDPNLILDGYLRLVYDATTNAVAISRFHHVTQLQIIDSNGAMIFSNAPVPGFPPLVPIGTPANPNGYTPNAVHFDGATGLVTTDVLATDDTGIISFAGWFNIDPSLSGKLEFSQGSGNNKLFFDTPIPPGWFHMMGTIDAGANQALLLVNGQAASGNPQATGGAFSSAPTNGKPFYIGTDTQGNFFKGDIADLSIWFDTSFIFSGGVPPSIIAKFVNVTETLGGVVSIEPVHPALTIFGSNILRQAFRWEPDVLGSLQKEIIPDIFLAGAADKLYGHTPIMGGNLDVRIQQLADLQTQTGTLTDAATAPGKIVLVPT